GVSRLPMPKPATAAMLPAIAAVKATRSLNTVVMVRSERRRPAGWLAGVPPARRRDGAWPAAETAALRMKAAWYERQGPAREVLIRIAASGVNPGDVKKRGDAFGYGMPYPRVIPHSDGAGTIDLLGDGVAAEWLGRRVWCFGAQSYRPFGTAAEFTVVPLPQA